MDVTTTISEIVHTNQASQTESAVAKLMIWFSANKMNVNTWMIKETIVGHWQLLHQCCIKGVPWVLQHTGLQFLGPAIVGVKIV